MTKTLSPGSGWVDSTLEAYEREQREKDRRPLTEKADPLALSWTAYYVWQKFPQRRWAAWGDLEVHDHDRIMAEQTRQYYRNKLALRALKSQGEITAFARELYDVCNGGIMRECHRGMLYRLPYFYNEDLDREHLRDSTRAMPGVDSLPPFLEGPSTRQLKIHGRIFHSRRRREIMEYWYHDVDTGYPVLWSVAYDNPLRSLVDRYFRTHEITRLRAHWKLGHDRANDFRFWIIYEPEFVFNDKI